MRKMRNYLRAKLSGDLGLVGCNVVKNVEECRGHIMPYG